MVEMDPNFVIGYVAPRASYGITAGKDDLTFLGVVLGPRFRVTATLDNAPLLGDVKAAVGGAGSLKTRSERLVWTVRSIDGCSELVDYIDEHSSDTPFEDSDQYETYTRWREAVKAIERGEHLTTDGAKRVLRIREELLTGDMHTNTTEELVERVEQVEDDV